MTKQTNHYTHNRVKYHTVLHPTPYEVSLYPPQFTFQLWLQAHIHMRKSVQSDCDPPDSTQLFPTAYQPRVPRIPSLLQHQAQARVWGSGMIHGLNYLQVFSAQCPSPQCLPRREAPWSPVLKPKFLLSLPLRKTSTNDIRQVSIAALLRP